MPAHRKIREIDVIQTVITPSYRFAAVSGTAGWRGGDVSGSISLYSGIRAVDRPHLVRPVSGSLTPSASLSYIELKLLDDSFEDRTHWTERHWKTIDGLYRHHTRFNPSYSTQSFDYQCLFFCGEKPNIVIATDSPSALWMLSTSSMCLEAWVKPFSTASHLHDGHTILSRTSLYWLGLTGSDCRLAFSSSLGMHTSSMGLALGQWSHVAVTVGANTGSMYVNLRHGKTFTYATGGLQISTASFDPAFCVGNVFGGPLSAKGGGGFRETVALISDSSGSHQRSFHGFIHEPREWKVGRSWTEISSSHNRRLSLDETANVVLSMPMTEGHKSGSSTFGAGSGTVNYARDYDSVQLALRSFTDMPSWQPNDNPSFYVDKRIARESSDYQMTTLRVVNIPRLLYGSSIVTGSFELTCRSFSSRGVQQRASLDIGLLEAQVNTVIESILPGEVGNTYSFRVVSSGSTSLFESGGAVTFTITGSVTALEMETAIAASSSLIRVRTPATSPTGTLSGFAFEFLAGGDAIGPGPRHEMIRRVRDDGRGGLYVHSYLSSSVDDAVTSPITWNRVGNIFYSEGIVVISNDSVLDLGQDSSGTSGQPTSMLSIEFNGVSPIPVKLVSCRLAGGDAGLSLNRTFYTEDAVGRRTAVSRDTYITSVVLHDSRKRPVAVAKLATPIRKRPGDVLNLRLRKDF